MKTIGIFLAVFLHVGFILFGGLVFSAEQKESHGTVQVVDLEPNSVTAETKKEEVKATAVQQTGAPIKTQDEPPPDSELLAERLEISAAASSHELRAMDLGAIDLLLNRGPSGAGGFGQGGSFESGGMIGGKGPKASAIEKKMEEAFRLDEMDQKPRPVFQAAPAYPSEMRGRKVEGIVTLLFVVDTTGRVVNQRVEKSNESAFEQPALNAVKQWKFEPGVKGGQRAACKMRVTVRFPKC